MGALFSSLLHFRSVMIVFILCLWFFFLHSTSTSYAFSYFGTETALKHTYRENSSLWSPWIFAFHMKTFPFASFYISSLRKCAIYMQNDYRYSLWLCRICAVMWYNAIHARIFTAWQPHFFTYFRVSLRISEIVFLRIKIWCIIHRVFDGTICSTSGKCSSLNRWRKGNSSVIFKFIEICSAKFSVSHC